MRTLSTWGWCTTCGGGTAAPEFVRRLAARDASEEEPQSSPRVIMRSFFWSPRHKAPDEDELMAEVLLTQVGKAPTAQARTLLTVPLFHVTGEVPVMLNSLVIGRCLVMMPKWDAWGFFFTVSSIPCLFHYRMRTGKAFLISKCNVWRK